LEHGKQFPPEKQVPKICILTPDLTVAFAGNPDLSERYLNDFPESASYKTTVDYLLDRHCEANRQVDFLALFNKPVPKIVQIRRGRIYLSMKTAWIGDQAAFEAFQRYRHSHPSASVTSVFEKVLMFSTHETVTHHDNATPQLLDALRYVIMDPRIESVFGFEVSVHNADGEFRYRDYAITLTEQQFSLAFPTVFLREKAPERDELRNYAASCFIRRLTNARPLAPESARPI
jgi:hypothetical protein